jgi:hypothetical protein
MQSNIPKTHVSTINRSLIFLALFALFFFTSAGAAQARDWYVSPKGDNTTGLSWKTALTAIPSLQFPISQIQPGDRIILDGGTAGYNYGMIQQWSVSGTATSPITMTTSNAAGHNGPVIFNGQTTDGLPYQPVGIVMAGSYCRLIGAKRDAIQVNIFQFQGVNVGGNGCVLANVQISNINPQIKQNGPGTGLTFSGTGNQFLNLDIYNCGIAASEFTGLGKSQTSTFHGCWFFDTYSSGSPGLTISDNNSASVMTIRNCVFGPGLGSGLTSTATAGQTTVDGCLFINGSSNNILVNSATGSTATMTVNKATSFMTATNYQGLAANCLSFNGSGALKIDNSIFWGGNVAVAVGVPVKVAGNFQYNTKGNTQVLAAHEVDPQFLNESQLAALTGTSTLGTFAGEDYAVAPGSPAYGKGASVVSASQLNPNEAGYF